MDFNVEEILNQILSENRAVGVVPYSAYVIEFVSKNNLDMADIPTGERKVVHHVIVAIKKKVGEILTTENLLQVEFPEYKKSLLELFYSIRDLPICDAFLKMQFDFIKKNYISPETDILYGLLFGFKVCDIRYYIQTRDQGMAQHSLEALLEQKIGNKERTLEEQTVMCEKCTAEYLKRFSN